MISSWNYIYLFMCYSNFQVAIINLSKCNLLQKYIPPLLNRPSLPGCPLKVESPMGQPLFASIHSCTLILGLVQELLSGLCSELDHHRETLFFTSTNCETIPGLSTHLGWKLWLLHSSSAHRFLTWQFSSVISLRTFHFPPQPSQMQSASLAKLEPGSRQSQRF